MSELPSSNNLTNQQNSLIFAIRLIFGFLGVKANFYETLSNVEIKSDLDLMNYVTTKCNLKIKQLDCSIKKLPDIPMPFLVQYTNGQYATIINADKEKILLFNAFEDKPRVMNYNEFSSKWTGSVYRFLYDNVLFTEISKFGFKWFIPIIYKYKSIFIEILIMSFFLQIFSLSTPFFTRVVIDKVIIHKGVSTLEVLMLGLLFINIFEITMGIARTYLFAHTSNKIDIILGTNVFKHLMDLPLKYFEARRVGDSVSRIRELEQIRQFITGSSLTVILDILFSVVFLFAMLYFSPELTMIAAVILPLFGILSFLVTPIIKRRLDYKFNCGSESNSYLVESMNGIQTIKSMALGMNVARKWDQLLTKYVYSAFQVNFLSNISGNLGNFIHKTLTLIILWRGSILVMNGGMTVGQLIAFQMLAHRMSEPIVRLANIWQEFQQVRISMRKIGDILDSPTEKIYDVEENGLNKIDGNISIQNINFRYKTDTKQVLSDITMDIKAGQFIMVP